MTLKELRFRYNKARLDDRLINELIGMCNGVVADRKINQAEAEFIQKWMIANQQFIENPMISPLFNRINEMLSDNILDDEEAQELYQTLVAYAGSDFEIGEIKKATTLPLDNPAPEIEFSDNRFCFTGTFAFGSRKDCENKTQDMGGTVGGLAQKTNYLVIGTYASDDWIHSSYGRKIEKAVEFKSDGASIYIISEDHWITFI